MLGNSLAYAAASCLFMAIGGCAVFQGSVSQPQPATSQPATEGTRQDYEVGSSPDHKASGPAVVALMKQAEQYLGEEQYQQAAAALERARRIEPKNPVIYSQLAAVMLAQEQPEAAENLARKSNSLAGRWPSLEARNWMTIARALRARGENASADAAERRANQLKKLSGK